MIRAIVFDYAGLNSAGQESLPRAAVKQDIVGFCLRALGAESEPPN